MKGLRTVCAAGIGGVYEIVFADSGVAAVAFPECLLPTWARGVVRADEGDPLVPLIREAFASWADGGDGPRELPLGLLSGTVFQREVWEVLRGIPRGTVRTYGEISAAVGRPAGARAVGRACAANPAPVVIPCHRVVLAGGPGGFGPGTEWKRTLLVAEGV